MYSSPCTQLSSCPVAEVLDKPFKIKVCILGWSDVLRVSVRPISDNTDNQRTTISREAELYSASVAGDCDNSTSKEFRANAAEICAIDSMSTRSSGFSLF